MNSRMRRTVATRVDFNLKELLEKVARSQERSQGSIIRLALREYLARTEGEQNHGARVRNHCEEVQHG